MSRVISQKAQYILMDISQPMLSRRDDQKCIRPFNIVSSARDRYPFHGLLVISQDQVSRGWGATLTLAEKLHDAACTRITTEVTFKSAGTIFARERESSACVANRNSASFKRYNAPQMRV